MNETQIKMISALLEWKLSNPTTLQTLKELKEESNTATTVLDVSVFAKKLFDALQLEPLYKELKLPIPTFDKDDDKNVNEGIKQIDKNLFKWF